MSELEFLRALHVEMLRHDRIGFAEPPHELFQTSTVQALVDGAFDGDVTLGELLLHGDLGLGTLDGLDGELIVVDGEAFKAELDCTLTRPEKRTRTPYAVVVPFAPRRRVHIEGPIRARALEARLWEGSELPDHAQAIRIDGTFARVSVRSVPRQSPPYPTLAEAIATQRVTELRDIPGTMVGFCFPDGLAGIEILGSHLHFACHQRQRGGHVLDYTVRDVTVHLDSATGLHVELPPSVEPPRRGDWFDQTALSRLERSGPD